MEKPIFEFKDEFDFLSNFFICSFEWNGIKWPHSEAAYQAAKTLDKNKQLEFTTLSPGQTKRKGRSLVMRPDWEEVKIEIMAEILFAKFDQNSQLKKRLIQTKNAHLEEGNSWGDRCWGVSPARSGNGNNHLGKLLMSLREIFTDHQFQSIIKFQ